jgi:hypothetical protein
MAQPSLHAPVIQRPVEARVSRMGGFEAGVLIVVGTMMLLLPALIFRQ